MQWTDHMNRQVHWAILLRNFRSKRVSGRGVDLRRVLRTGNEASKQGENMRGVSASCPCALLLASPS